MLKAAIIGSAWRTPLGSNVGEVVDRLLAGERAAAVNARFDASAYTCQLAAAMTQSVAPSRNARFLRRMGLHAVAVAAEALDSAGIKGSDRVGLFFGYGGLRAHWDDLMPAFERQEAGGANAWNCGLDLLHPFWMLQHLSNNAHAIAAQELGARGEGATYGGANAGAQALGAAIRALAAGAVDVALVVGYDSLIEPETLVELAARGACVAGAASPATPYDINAAGFVPGEAAAALVLQRPGEGECIACVQAQDAADGEKGEALAGTLARLVRAVAQPGDVVDGAGLARPEYDAQERLAAAQVTGDDAALCCIMSAMGQIGAASSVVQTIALAELLRRRMLPPIAGLQRAAGGPLRPLMQAEATTARSAIGLCAGAPGLAGIIRVELA
ncbi:beta-ketoacyl synthase N-terminal-like domain-containing protein [Massilia sp. TSP1-1-2]|uniref:beta-ketoacyl synthase N-terminal-like domain-containing protein n=1 Tax=Massilia sp. TSP1-1-2 TaxID=2804649 RepID=UPI003CFB43CC